MRPLVILICIGIACSFLIDIGVQSAAKHNTGSDCYDCHKKKEFSAAGTVFKNYNGKGTKKNVKIKLVDQMGIVTDLGKSNKSGNIAVSQKIKKGRYLIQVGDRRSKSWHAFPRDKSCNTCHTIGGNGTVVLEERHTWLPLGNSCTTCHFFPANFNAADLSTPGTLTGKKVKLIKDQDKVMTPFGTFTFSPDDVNITSLRGDIFAPGFYSFFDVLVSVGKKNNLDLKYHYDADLKTHVIDSIIGDPGPWWYGVGYEGGNRNASEINNYRMDEYLYKPGSALRIYKIPQQNMDRMVQAFRDEIEREKSYPKRETRVARVGFNVRPSNYQGNPAGSRRDSWNAEFTDVRVTAHNLRAVQTVSTPYGPALAHFVSPAALTPQPFQPGVITSMDVILSLQDQGQLDSVLTAWMEKINSNRVRSYYLQQLSYKGKITHSSGMQGFVYRAGYNSPSQQPNGERNLHIPADTRVLHSTNFEEWRWIELGPPIRGNKSNTTASNGKGNVKLDCGFPASFADGGLKRPFWFNGTCF